MREKQEEWNKNERLAADDRRANRSTQGSGIADKINGCSASRQSGMQVEPL